MNRPRRDTNRAVAMDVWSVEQIAIRCGVDPEFVAQLVAYGVIDPVPGRQDAFYSVVTLRVLKVVRIQRDLGVNLQGAAVILDLLRRIEKLEREARLCRG